METFHVIILLRDSSVTGKRSSLTGKDFFYDKENIASKDIIPIWQCFILERIFSQKTSYWSDNALFSNLLVMFRHEEVSSQVINRAHVQYQVMFRHEDVSRR